MAGIISRRALLLAAPAVVAAGSAGSQPAPSRLVRILLGFAAGGATDVIARLYAQKMQQILGVPVIVENKPGAAQLVAIRAMQAAAPDGATLVLATGSGLAQGPGVMKDLPYDPLRDFSLIGMMATAPGVFFVHPELPIRSMAELVAYAKANPGKLNYGSAGVGTANHLQMEYLKQLTGIDLVHVPYRSDQEVSREVMTGAIQVGMGVVQAALPLIGAGSLRALAVTGKDRLRAMPEVPSLAETGIAALQGIENYTFYGLVGPAGLSGAVIDRMNATINEVSSMPDVVAQMRDVLLFEPAQGTPAAFRQYLVEEVAKWREVGRSLDMPAWGR